MEYEEFIAHLVVDDIDVTCRNSYYLTCLKTMEVTGIEDYGGQEYLYILLNIDIT